MTADETTAHVQGNAKLGSNSEPTISDEIVQAYDDGEAMGMVSNRRLSGWPLRAAAISAGLAAVVPLIRAQVQAEADAREERAWHRGFESARRHARITPAVPRTFAAPVTVRIGEGFHEPDEPVADVQAAFEAGEKGATRRPMSNREFIAAEVERLGLQPQVDAMWTEIENGPPMPPGWCTWHQTTDCHGDAPECREARADIERESIEDALENDRCGICGSVEHFREDHPVSAGTPLPPVSDETREHPGTGQPTEGVPGIPDGVEREYVLGQKRSEENEG